MPDDQVWAMPLVAHVEKSAPPRRTDALEAAAKATLLVWRDPRAVTEWDEAFSVWLNGKFRKVTRRARGAQWERVSALPGVTVTVRSAEVRAFPPCPVNETPRDIARLQVSGTDLTDVDAAPVPADDIPVLWVSPEVEMTAGKAMAQVGHAAMLMFMSLPSDTAAGWEAAGFPLAVRTADRAAWRSLAISGLPGVRDAGFTEVAPMTLTVVCEWRPLGTAG